MASTTSSPPPSPGSPTIRTSAATSRPVGPEIDAADLPVVAGRIPEELSGAYLRNGVQPAVQAIVLHLPVRRRRDDPCRLSGQRAGALPQPVRADARAEVERRAGRAVYGGVMRPVPVDPALVGADGAAGAVQERRLHQRHPPWRQGPGAVRGHDRLRDDHGAGDRGRVARRHRRAARAGGAQPAPSAHGRAVRADLRGRPAAGARSTGSTRAAGSWRRSPWSWPRRR